MVRSSGLKPFSRWRLAVTVALLGMFAISSGLSPVVAQDAKPEEKKDAPPPPDYPPHAEVLKGFEKVVSTAEGDKSLYTLWIRKKDSQMYAELPSGFASQKYFFALTIASGDQFAGLQSGEMYVYWRQYDKRLALIEPNVETRSTGDDESKASVNRLFTDRVVLDVPIVTMGPGGGPVIDMDQLLVGQAANFFGMQLMQSSLRTPQRPAMGHLYSLKTAKAFPENVEIAYEVPTPGGQLKSLHYSISRMPENTSYKPRKADERIGYFVTAYSDLGKYTDRETRTRYITRWNLEKRDKSLALSPPKTPIRFYVENTTPVRYRRWVKQGVLYWNKAFEKVGLLDAIEVEYQDASTGQHMDKDPEDVRYNFIRWLNNNIGTAIGPSRVNPMTGQILDADIVLTDGWIRHYWNQYHEVLPQLAMEGMSAETLAWLADHPDWDPRVRLASPAQRPEVMAQIAREAAQPYAGHPAASATDSRWIGKSEYDGLIGRTSQVSGLCMAASGKGMDLAVLRMHLDLLAAEQVAADKKDEEKKEEEKKDGEKKEDEKKDGEKKEEAKKDEKKEEKKNLLDGIPEEFIGPLVAELVAHEVGHTLGLRHNFKATGIYSLAEINSAKMKGQKPFAGSVMDYIPVNMNVSGGEQQGDITMFQIGPYDEWVIEYGYTFNEDLKPILDRVAEPELAYATDEDTGGPDPLARRYDFSKNPLDYANDQMRLAKHHRERIIDKFVKDGESWSYARRGYEMTLFLQTRALSTIANWIGGSSINRDKKGDKNGRAPIEVIDPQMQRDALKFVIDNSFEDGAFGLTPDLLTRMTVDKWLDDGGFSVWSTDPTWPVHDRIMGIQATTLTLVMNPTTLRRVYDNEIQVPSDKDALTLPELLQTISANIWRELDSKPEKQATARQPLISSLRRNLQREHVKRLIDLTLPGMGGTEAYKPISDLALMELRTVRDKVNALLEGGGGMLDPYTQAHLTRTKDQIDKALNAQYIYNARDIGGGGSIRLILGSEGEQQQQPQP